MNDMQELLNIAGMTAAAIESDKLVWVVRCQDCVNKKCWVRTGDVVCGIDGTPHRPDWYCAYGVKKDD